MTLVVRPFTTKGYRDRDAAVPQGRFVGPLAPRRDRRPHKLEKEGGQGPLGLGAGEDPHSAGMATIGAVASRIRFAGKWGTDSVS